jgi:hypothetical protein
MGRPFECVDPRAKGSMPFEVVSGTVPLSLMSDRIQNAVCARDTMNGPSVNGY